jgi:hypothetical protein
VDKISLTELCVYNAQKCYDHILSARKKKRYNKKGCGRKWQWSNLRYYPSIFQERLSKTTNSVRIINVLLRSEPLKYKFDMLCPEPTFFVGCVLFRI